MTPISSSCRSHYVSAQPLRIFGRATLLLHNLGVVPGERILERVASQRCRDAKARPRRDCVLHAMRTVFVLTESINSTNLD